MGQCAVEASGAVSQFAEAFRFHECDSRWSSKPNVVGAGLSGGCPR